MSAPPGAAEKAGGALRRPAQRITKAGDWFAARQAGKRLPEHLFDEEIEAALWTQRIEQEQSA